MWFVYLCILILIVSGLVLSFDVPAAQRILNIIVITLISIGIFILGVAILSIAAGG